MARIRTIKPDFFDDEDLADLDFQTRLFFAGLWCYADKEGRLEYRPKYLKAKIFPYDDADIPEMIDKLTVKRRSQPGFLTVYQVSGKTYIQINTFEKHQRPHHTEKSREFPAPPNGTRSLTVKQPSQDGEKKEGREGKGREGKGYKTTTSQKAEYFENPDPPPPREEGPVLKTARAMIRDIASVDSSLAGKANPMVWAKGLENLKKETGDPLETIHSVWSFCREDDFWYRIILKPGDLMRGDNYSKAKLKMVGNPQAPPKKGGAVYRKPPERPLTADPAELQMRKAEILGTIETMHEFPPPRDDESAIRHFNRSRQKLLERIQEYEAIAKEKIQAKPPEEVKVPVFDQSKPNPIRGNQEGN